MFFPDLVLVGSFKFTRTLGANEPAVLPEVPLPHEAQSNLSKALVDILKEATEQLPHEATLRSNQLCTQQLGKVKEMTTMMMTTVMMDNQILIYIDETTLNR